MKKSTVDAFAISTMLVSFGSVLSSLISLAFTPSFLIMSVKPYKFLIPGLLESRFVLFDGSIERQEVASKITPNIANIVLFSRARLVWLFTFSKTIRIFIGFFILLYNQIGFEVQSDFISCQSNVQKDTYIQSYRTTKWYSIGLLQRLIIILSWHVLYVISNKSYDFS